MDLNTFGTEDFDPKTWINKAWITSGNQDKEVFVSSTMSRLHLYMKQLTNSLDETTTQIVTSIPRILQDASSLQVEGTLIQQNLLNLEKKVKDVEERTGNSIDSLQRIDCLKNRLENAASALREADKWTALASSLEDILDAGVPTQKDLLSQLTEKVASMTASLDVLNDAPDYEKKRLQLESLYNSLEAVTTTPLYEALQQKNAEKTSTYVALYEAMRRRKSLIHCWRRSATAHASDAWRRLETHSLTALTDILHANAHTQLQWLTDVLKSEQPLTELIKLHTDLLLSIEPSTTKVLTANLKFCATPEEAVTLLIDSKGELDQFTTIFIKLLESRHSKESVQSSTIKEFGKSVYAPIREILPKYTDYQTQAYLKNLEDKGFGQDDLLERSRYFQNLIERCEGWFLSSHTNGRKIAENAIYPYFIPAVEAFASMLCSKISSHSRKIEAEFHATSGNSGVLSISFPATLALGSAVGVLLDSLAVLLNNVAEKLRLKSEKPLQAIEKYILDDYTRQNLTTTTDLGCIGALKRLQDTMKTLAINILREPVQKQLDKIPSLPVWSNNDALSTDLPDYALSPHEYITEVGQYLMTLPQHLEMHLTEKQAPWQFLNEVCNYTCDLFAEKILNVRNMDHLGTKRCLTDIVYLSSVVEDLGSNVTSCLKNLEKTLRTTTINE